MSPRESRFSQNKPLTPEMKALPVLTGETSVYANPVDTYLAGKSDATKRMVQSHMNKVAILFDYPDYAHTPWGSIRYEHVQTLIGVAAAKTCPHHGQCNPLSRPRHGTRGHGHAIDVRRRFPAHHAGQDGLGYAPTHRAHDEPGRDQGAGGCLSE